MYQYRFVLKGISGMDEKGFCFENIVPSMFHVVDRYCDDKWFVPPFQYGLHNFMLIVSGKGTSLTDGRRYEVHSGTLVYHNCTQVFGFESSNSDPMHCFGVNFRIAEIFHESGVWSLKNAEKLPFSNFINISDMEILIKYFSDLVHVWDERSINCQLKLRSIFLNILYEVSSQLFIQQSNIESIKSIEFVKSYIRKNYAEQLTLNSLAGLTGLNPNYFGSIFKKHTGKTPIEYVNSVRIQKAEEILSLGHTASEAAFLSGFRDPFYFSKIFKKIKGVSPRDYKKNPINFC